MLHSYLHLNNSSPFYLPFSGELPTPPSPLVIRSAEWFIALQQAASTGGRKKGKVDQEKKGARGEIGLFGVWSTYRSNIKYTWYNHGARSVRRNKGRGEREEGRATGDGARSACWWGGSVRVSFQDGFYGVTSNVDLPHPRPCITLLPRSIRPSIRPSLLFLTIVYGQVDSNWLFFHEADFSPRTGRGPLLPLRSVQTCVSVCVCAL